MTAELAKLRALVTEQAKTLAAVNRKLETVEDGLHDVTQDLGELQVLHCSEGAHAFACIFVFAKTHYLTIPTPESKSLD